MLSLQVKGPGLPPWLVVLHKLVENSGDGRFDLPWAAAYRGLAGVEPAVSCCAREGLGVSRRRQDLNQRQIPVDLSTM